MFFILIFSLAISSISAYCPESEKDLTDKVVIVTGAAQGIGYAIADNFLKQGVKLIIILDIKAKEGENVAKEFNNVYGEGKAVFIYCDVRYDLDRVSEYIIETYGYVDVLVNDAGILNEYDPRAMIMTDLIALIEWSLRFRENMRWDKCGRGGTIFNVASIVAYYDQPFLVSYEAGKHGVLGFSKSLGHVYNYRNTCVRVLAICPGFTHTAMTAHPNIWKEQMVDYDRFAKKVPWQSADDVGKGAVQVFQNASTGTAWQISGGKPPVKAPTLVTITLEDILG